MASFKEYKVALDHPKLFYANLNSLSTFQFLRHHFHLMH